MKTTLIVIFLLTICMYGNAQKNGEVIFYDKIFQWKISIPAGFESVPLNDWGKMQQRGADAIGKTIDEEIAERPTQIFVFRSGQLNYIESNWTSADTSMAYEDYCKASYDVLYETLKSEMPGVTLDTVATTTTVDDLEFQTFAILVKFPNNVVMQMYMYSRIFADKELTVNITFLEQEKGDQLLNNWKTSTFGRVE